MKKSAHDKFVDEEMQSDSFALEYTRARLTASKLEPWPDSAMVDLEASGGIASLESDADDDAYREQAERFAVKIGKNSFADVIVSLESGELDGTLEEMRAKMLRHLLGL